MADTANTASVSNLETLVGGSANFRVDREAAERAYTAWPGGLAGVRADALAHRALLGRIVRYLVRDAGVRQFLDIGTGIPKEDNVHEVAQREAPESPGRLRGQRPDRAGTRASAATQFARRSHEVHIRGVARARDDFG